MFIINHSKDYIDKDAINAYILSNPELKMLRFTLKKKIQIRKIQNLNSFYIKELLKGNFKNNLKMILKENRKF